MKTPKVNIKVGKPRFCLFIPNFNHGVSRLPSIRPPTTYAKDEDDPDALGRDETTLSPEEASLQRTLGHSPHEAAQQEHQKFPTQP